MSYRVWSAALLLLFASHSSFAVEVISGRVIALADGDTVTVLDSSQQQHKIRLAGIDAPERAQAFGNRSKQHLSEAIFGKTVRIEFYKRDRYRRKVGVVRLEGIDMNLRQVEDGFAWHDLRYAHEQTHEDRIRYSSAEANARRNRLGLWVDPNPVPPWVFRKSRR